MAAERRSTVVRGAGASSSPRSYPAALKRGEKAKAKVTVKLTDRAGNTRDREAAGEAEARLGGHAQRRTKATEVRAAPR